MTQQNEVYVLNNLIAIATGHATGEFIMDDYWAGVFLRMIEKEPGTVSFFASVEFAKKLEEFKNRPREDQMSFAKTAWQILNRCCDGKMRVGVGAEMALGLFLLFDEDFRWHCERGDDDSEDES